jgi:hypothetical protein
VTSTVSRGYHDVVSGIERAAAAATRAFNAEMAALDREIATIDQEIRDLEAEIRHAAARAVHVVTHDVKRVYHAAVHVSTTVWHETVHVAKAADTFVHHHAAAITSIAAGAAVFVGCEALTAGVGTVGCAAAAGAVANLVSYGMSCGSAARGCSVTGALLSAGSGALAGAVGGALIGPLGGELSSSVLGDVLPDIAIRGLAGATAGAAAGAAGGASQYAGGCLRGASCSLSGLGKATAGGAEAGAIIGGVGGALDPGLTRAACGGESFSAGTKVLTASGAVVAISMLSKGQKVVATNTKTGKTSAETIAAVLVHHDTNLYNLKVRTGPRTAVIQTTSNHLFWDATARRWVKAAALKYGHYLRTPAGDRATAAGGYTPRAGSGWMWDLTVTTDHDFYIQAAAIAVLVHNCGDDPTDSRSRYMNPVEDRRIFSYAETYPKAAGVLHVAGQEQGIPLLSGISGPAEAVRGQGLPGFSGVQATHVEGHAAAYMRTNGIRSGNLEINRVPCEEGSGGGCNGLLPSMLPEGGILRVYGPEGYFKAFIGMPDS